MNRELATYVPLPIYAVVASLTRLKISYTNVFNVQSSLILLISNFKVLKQHYLANNGNYCCLLLLNGFSFPIPIFM